MSNTRDIVERLRDYAQYSDDDVDEAAARSKQRRRASEEG